MLISGKQRAGKPCVYLSVDFSLGLVGLTHVGESQEAGAVEEESAAAGRWRDSH